MSRGGDARLPFDLYPVGTGAVAGAVSFVVGYVLTVAVLLIDWSQAGDGGPGANGDGESSGQALEFFGTVFLEGHAVELETRWEAETLTSGTISGTEQANMIDEVSATFPDTVYFAIPVVVLFLGGFVAATVLRNRLEGPVPAVAAGGSIVLGYLPLSVIAADTMGFGGEFEREIVAVQFTIVPLFEDAVLRAGFAYPIALGALGGLAFYALRAVWRSRSGGDGEG